MLGGKLLVGDSIFMRFDVDFWKSVLGRERWGGVATRLQAISN